MIWQIQRQSAHPEFELLEAAGLSGVEAHDCGSAAVEVHSGQSLELFGAGCTHREATILVCVMRAGIDSPVLRA